MLCALARRIRFAFAAEERAELARKRQGVRIFAAGEVRVAGKYAQRTVFVLSRHSIVVPRSARPRAESGSHSPPQSASSLLVSGKACEFSPQAK